MKKIVILGGESTGKSTLSAALAEQFQGVYVEEFARDYVSQLKRPYEEKDLLEIAKGQLDLELQAYKESKAIMFCDTDLHVIMVWSEHKYGHCHAAILKSIATSEVDAFILTAPDFPWEPDILREHPEEKYRQYFFTWYLELVSHQSKPFIIVTGNQEERLQQAISFVEKLS